MYPVSPEFLSEIRQGPTVITKADIYKAGFLIAENVPIVTGNIIEDPGATVRRRCSVELAIGDFPELVPAADYKDDFGTWPTGTEIRIAQGVRYHKKSLGTEWVPLGSFRIAKPTVTDTGDDLKLTIQGYDLSRTINRARFTDTFDVPAGWFINDAILRIIQRQCPWIPNDQFDLVNASAIGDYSGKATVTTPHVVLDRGDEPWTECKNLALAAGMDLFVSGDRKIVLRQLPNPEFDIPTTMYEEGEFNIVTSMERSLDDEDAYNGVIVTGENSSNPTIARGEAWDRDLTSPTYFDPSMPSASSYGPNPKFINSQYITDSVQAGWVAVFEFFKMRGILENIRLTAVPNFAHEGNDLIGLKRSRMNVDGAYILQSFSLGLGEGGVLEGTVRSRSLTQW